MKSFMNTLVVMAMFSAPAAWADDADDADDVKAAVMESRAQENAGNVDGYFQYHVPQFTIFPPTSGFLSEAPDKEVSQARFDAGMKFNMQIRNFDMKVYGDTAITTYYSVGPVQRPGSSTSERWNLRITGVWIKESGDWKLVHRHESPLVLRSTPRIEDRFVGTWRLVDFERRGPDGELRPLTNPYSKGLLVYTSTGHISQQLTREGRQKFSGRASGEEAQEALYSYIAYFGTFTVNEAQGAVTHHRQGHLIHSRVTDGIRLYRFVGNRLMLTAPGAGEEMTTTLTWERIE